MLKKLFSIIIVLYCMQQNATAQEFSCKVRVLHEKIQGVDNQLFLSMERLLTAFLNNRKWTNDDFGINEKIECNFMLNVTTRMNGDNDGFAATLNIQASRPVYNSDYKTQMVNFVDRDIVFHFSQYSNLDFDDSRVSGNDPLASNLPAVFAYYAYIILALDYDSFSQNAGTPYLKKAQNIVNNAPEQGKTITGWKSVEGNRNRYWIVDQLLSTRFTELRNYWYSMHREGLDNMFTKPQEARQRILAGLSTLVQIQKENPASILMQFIFNAKSDEFVKLVTQLPKQERTPYVNALSQIDVGNVAKYNALK